MQQPRYRSLHLRPETLRLSLSTNLPTEKSDYKTCAKLIQTKECNRDFYITLSRPEIG